MYNYEGKVSQTRGCDECHLHRPDAPVVDQWTYRKKILAPPCLGEALRREILVNILIFMVWV